MPFNSLFEFSFCNIFKQSFEYVPWHYVTLTPCIYFISELLFCYHLHKSLPPQLIVTDCCSYVQNQYSLFQFHLHCTLGPSLPLFHLLPYFFCCSILSSNVLSSDTPQDIFPYAGHCLSGCTPPQYWHGCCCNIWPTRTLAVSSYIYMPHMKLLPLIMQPESLYIVDDKANNIWQQW